MPRGWCAAALASAAALAALPLSGTSGALGRGTGHDSIGHLQSCCLALAAAATELPGNAGAGVNRLL